MNNNEDKQFTIIISGPTGCGKTDLSLKLASKIPAEIINADVGQFYESLSVGTAKPDWKNQTVKHHLFDILSEPKNMSVFEFRSLICKKVDKIYQDKKIPIIVGGSQFYLKSLLFPPKEFSPVCIAEGALNGSSLWEELNKIDPARASKIHPNDIYRISRAINIWKKYGKLPSECKPDFDPPFNFIFISILPTRDVVYKRIDARTDLMLDRAENSPWVLEVESLNTQWKNFLNQKGLIGYKEILSWIESGKNKKDFSDLVLKIKTLTRNYAKRQLIFWKSFSDDLTKNRNDSPFLCDVVTLNNYSEESFEHLLQLIHQFKDNV